MSKSIKIGVREMLFCMVGKFMEKQQQSDAVFKQKQDCLRVVLNFLDVLEDNLERFIINVGNNYTSNSDESFEIEAFAVTKAEGQMERGRVTSVVEDTWGKATVFNPDPYKSEERIHIDNEDIEAYDMAMDNMSLSHMSPESVEEFEGIYSEVLPYLLTSLFGTLLEDSITQLRILVECNNELRIIKTQSDWTALLGKKYGVSQPKVIDELDGIDVHQLGCDSYKINKLDNDRKYITDVLTDLYVEMSLNKSYKTLENYTSAILAKDEYREALIEDEAKNKILKKELNRQLRQQRNHIKLVIYDTDVKIDRLRTQVEDSTLYAECRGRYIDNWQHARMEQHKQVIFDKESVHTSAIEYYKERTDNEQRVHSEVEMLINIAINETLKQVEEWMDKYDTDMEAIDLKIQIKKNDYQNMMDKRIGLEKTIEKHDKLMKDWVTFKEERQKAREYSEKMTKSAITVQAWWRGLLVRKQLGPYRPKRKGRGKK